MVWVLVAYFVAFRFGLTFLLGVGADVNVRPMVTISEYFDIFVNVILGIAIVFELPILIFFLTLLRIVETPVLPPMIETCVELMGGAYPDLADHADRTLPPVCIEDLQRIALADPADGLLDRCLPVAGPHERGAGGGQRVQRGGADLGGAGAEAAVGGQQVLGGGDVCGQRALPRG